MSGFGAELGFGTASNLQAFDTEGLCAEHVLIFKKIAKKDSTTKIKGLEELKKILDSEGIKEDENYETVNRWCSGFWKLAEDCSPKVRLLSVKLMGAIGKKFKSKLKSKLKEIIPPWLCLVYDPRSEVAAAAVQALDATIPEARRKDTISFTRKSILNYINDHISSILESNGGILTTSNSQNANMEEVENFSRICCTNINLLSILCENTSNEDFSKHLSQQVDEIMETWIWKMFKTTDSKIKIALNHLLNSLTIQSTWIQDSSKSTRLQKITKLAIANISDKDRMTHAKSWETLVLLLHRCSSVLFDDANTWFNPTSTLLPSVLTSLKLPPHDEVYNAILPLLSKLPAPLLISKGSKGSMLWIDDLLSSIWNTIPKQDTAISVSSATPSEKAAQFEVNQRASLITTTYFECLIYLISKFKNPILASSSNTSDKPDQNPDSASHAIQINLLKSHFLPIMIAFLNYEKRISPNICSNLALFISRLDAKAEYEHLSKLAWIQLNQLVVAQFSSQTEQPTAVFVSNMKQLLNEEALYIQPDSHTFAFLQQLISAPISYLIPQITSESSSSYLQLDLISAILLSRHLQESKASKTFLELSRSRIERQQEALTILQSASSLPSFVSSKLLQLGAMIPPSIDQPSQALPSATGANLSSGTSIDKSQWKELLKAIIQHEHYDEIVSHITKRTEAKAEDWMDENLDQLAIKLLSPSSTSTLSPNTSLVSYNSILSLLLFSPHYNSSLLSLSALLQLSPIILQRGDATWNAFTAGTIDEATTNMGMEMLDYTARLVKALSRSKSSDASQHTLSEQTLNFITEASTKLVIWYSSISSLSENKKQPDLKKAAEQILSQTFQALFEFFRSDKQLVSVITTSIAKCKPSNLKQILKSSSYAAAWQSFSEASSMVMNSLLTFDDLSSAASDFLISVLPTIDTLIDFTKTIQSLVVIDKFALGVGEIAHLKSVPQPELYCKVLDEIYPILMFLCNTLKSICKASEVIRTSGTKVATPSVDSPSSQVPIRIQFIDLAIYVTFISNLLKSPLQSEAAKQLHTEIDHLNVTIPLALNTILLSSIINPTDYSGFSQLMAALNNLRTTHKEIPVNWLFDTLMEFVITVPNSTQLIEYCWNSILMPNPDLSLSLTKGDLNKKWLSLLPNETVRLGLSKYLGDVYILKMLPHGSTEVSEKESQTAHLGFHWIALICNERFVKSGQLISQDLERKILEVLVFSMKLMCSITQSKDSLEGIPNNNSQILMISFLQFLTHAVFECNQISEKLTESNYSAIFDLMEPLCKRISFYKKEIGPDFDSSVPVQQSKSSSSDACDYLTFMTFKTFDAIGRRMTLLGVTNQDWADFINQVILKHVFAFSWLDAYGSQWDFNSSMFQSWNRILRFASTQHISRIGSKDLSGIYKNLFNCHNLQLQLVCYIMISNFIKDRNSKTIDRTFDSSSLIKDNDAVSSSSEEIVDEILDSKVLPLELQQLVLDLEVGYLDPVHPEETLYFEEKNESLMVAADVHSFEQFCSLAEEDALEGHRVSKYVFDVSVSVCATTLIGWKLIIEHLNSNDGKEKSDVCTWIRQSQLLDLLFPLIFNLLDEDIPLSSSSLDSTGKSLSSSTSSSSTGILLKSSSSIGGNSPHAANIKSLPPSLEMFAKNNGFPVFSNSLTSTNLDYYQQCQESYKALKILAFYVAKNLFEKAPAMVRQWWNNSSSSLLSSKVERFSIHFISPALIQKELANVSSWKPAVLVPGLPQDFKMKALHSPSSESEVVATYLKDELELAITLKIPASYPLKPVNVQMSHKAVSESLWRKWLLSMRSLLLTRDGALIDAVLMWKEYLDKHFEGIECCPICYAIFHISNFTTPNLACKTCKNKFHSACLYKWFNTSHHNECPLCKTPFN